MRVAPLLLIAVGLIVVFKARIWNLGMDGQFLLAAAVIAGSARGSRSTAERDQPRGAVPHRRRGRGRVDDRAGGAEGPLRAQRDHHDADDRFIGINLAQILVKGPFQDRRRRRREHGRSISPRSRRSPARESSAALAGVHVGVVVALAAAFVVWFLLSRTSFGLRLQVLGASTRSARHMGLDVPRLIVVTFLLSGMFVGFAAATEILGVKGYQRADWNPAFGLSVVPLVFLALHPIGVIPYVASSRSPPSG